MVYKLIIIDKAAKALRRLRLPPRTLEQIEAAIKFLAVDPKPHGVTVLQGKLLSYMRVRVGDYRIVYTIDNDKVIVIVVSIGHRKDIYKKLK